MCLTGKPHYWIEILFGGVKSMNFMRAFEYSALLRSVVRFALNFRILPSQVYASRAKMAQYTIEKLRRLLIPAAGIIVHIADDCRRIDNPPGRTDFLQKMIAENQKQEWTGRPFQELTSQATSLIVAGSETTATTLCGVTYFLCLKPQVYEKLATEVRSSFATYNEITGKSTDSLQYLRAVIDESLRIYPPIAAGLPRVSPGEIVDGNYVPKGTIVSVNTWVAGHIERNFHEPFEFIPERWLDPNCKDDKSASQPFLLGSRVCLGRK